MYLYRVGDPEIVRLQNSLTYWLFATVKPLESNFKWIEECFKEIQFICY